MFRGWREKDQSYFSRFFTKKIVGKTDVKKMERKKSPLPSKIDAADRRVGWAGGALSNIDPESSRESEVPQKFREKRGNATGNNGRRGKKLFSVFFPGRFFSFKIHGTQGGKVPEKEEE